MNNLYEQIMNTLSEMICPSTIVMSPYATPVVGSVNIGKANKRKNKVIEIKKAVMEAFEGAKQNKGTQKRAMLGYRYKKQWSKNMGISEKIMEIADICEAIINEEGVGDKVKHGVKKFLGLEKEQHPSYYTPIAKELRDARDNMHKVGDEADAYYSRAARATGHRKQVNQENAMDKEREYGIAHNNHRKLKTSVLDFFRSKGDSNPEAHKKLHQMMGEAEEIFNTLEALKELQGE